MCDYDLGWDSGYNYAIEWVKEQIDNCKLYLNHGMYQIERKEILKILEEKK